MNQDQPKPEADRAEPPYPKHTPLDMEADPKEAASHMKQYFDKLTAAHNAAYAHKVASFAFMCQLCGQNIPDNPRAHEVAAHNFKIVGMALKVNPVDVSNMILAVDRDTANLQLRNALMGGPAN